MLDAEERRKLRQSRAKPVCDALYEWMVAQRKLVSEGSAIAKALDYSLKRWEALTRYLDDGHVPIDNNWVENQIRPGLSAGPTGCSPARYEQASALPPS